MVGIREITPEQWAVLVKVLGQYATGAPFRPVFLKQVRGVVHRILALRTEGGAYSDKPNARRARLQSGIDPKTFEVIDQESFGFAVSRALEAVENTAKGKSQAGSNGESSSEVEVLTPLAAGQKLPIRKKLGPARAAPKPLAQQFPPAAPDPSEIAAVQKITAEPNNWFEQKYAAWPKAGH